jgi:hypothetical protein
MAGMPANIAFLDPVCGCLGGAAGAQRVRREVRRIGAGRRCTTLDDQRDGPVGRARAK